MEITTMKCARTIWALIMLCAFASAAGAQVTVPTSNKFPVRMGMVTSSDDGSMVSNLYIGFDPDTVIEYGVTVVVVDSSDTIDNQMTIDVTGRWKGALHTERATVHIDAEYIFPHTAGGVGGFPDSVFYLTWDKPGDGDRYTYQSKTQTTPIYHSSGSMIQMGIFEYYLAHGDVYTITADSALAGANDTLEVAIVTPSDKQIHLWWGASVSSKCWFFIKSAPTLSAVADTITIVNSNYRSSNTSTSIALKAPRTAATGTRVWTELIGSGKGSGGNMLNSEGIILKASTTYVFGVASTAATDASMIITIKETLR